MPKSTQVLSSNGLSTISENSLVVQGIWLYLGSHFYNEYVLIIPYSPLNYHLLGCTEDSEPELWRIAIPTVWETEAGESQVSGLPGLQSMFETLLKNKGRKEGRVTDICSLVIVLGFPLL